MYVVEQCGRNAEFTKSVAGGASVPALHIFTGFGRQDVWLFQGVHNYPMKHIQAIYKVPSILCVSSQHLVQSRCVRFTGTPSAR
jgi:hypothetical protein